MSFDMPGIPIDSENLEILDTPDQFYQALLEHSKNCKSRIALSSLYLGDGELEKKLISTIEERLDKGEVEVTILLDYLRGTRENEEGVSSVSVMKPIADRAKLFLYHTPQLRGFLKRVLPQRADEIVGLQHMKLYIFDDDVIISGANLSDTYFTNRMDRYYLFKNCKPLADFFADIIETIGETSFVVKEDEIVASSEAHPFHDKATDYRKILKEKVEAVVEKYRKSAGNDGESKTRIFPILQMGLLGINQEFDLLKKIFAEKNPEIKMTVASGYFNFIEDYEHIIFRQGTYDLDILTASPLANGFFGSKGFSKYIPPLYSNISTQFIQKSIENHRENVKMYEYGRDGWTFHAKGLWIEKKNQMTTFIGSSNYGFRSVHRDLEAQVMVVTEEKELIDRLKREKNQLFEFSTVLDAAALQKPEHYVPTIVRVVSRFFRSFL